MGSWTCSICGDTDINKDFEFYHDGISRTITFKLYNPNVSDCKHRDFHLKCFHEWLSNRKARHVDNFWDHKDYSEYYSKCMFCGAGFHSCVIRKSITTLRYLRKKMKRSEYLLNSPETSSPETSPRSEDEIENRNRFNLPTEDEEQDIQIEYKPFNLWNDTFGLYQVIMDIKIRSYMKNMLIYY